MSLSKIIFFLPKSEQGNFFSKKKTKRPPRISNGPCLIHTPFYNIRVVPWRCRTGTLKNPAKCLRRWEPDRRYNYFFSPPATLWRRIYDWNIVACDVKHPINQIKPYPERAVKGDSMGRFLGINVYKGQSHVCARMGTLKNPAKCLWCWEPDCRSNFVGPPADLCDVIYMTEISFWR